MKTKVITIIIALLSCISFDAVAEDVLSTSSQPKDIIDVTNAWARSSMLPSNNSVAYMVLQNNTNLSYEIVGATSADTANDVLIQQSFVDDKGVSRIIVVDKLVIPAHSKVELKPNGTHIMLMNLKHELHEGQKITIDLIVDGVGSQTVPIEVKGLGQQ
jgi:copper(I)-binding protein